MWEAGGFLLILQRIKLGMEMIHLSSAVNFSENLNLINILYFCFFFILQQDFFFNLLIK